MVVCVIDKDNKGHGEKQRYEKAKRIVCVRKIQKVNARCSPRKLQIDIVAGQDVLDQFIIKQLYT